MVKFKDIMKRIARFFGFEKHSRYVANHMVEADVRSAVFMAAIIVVLETWMIIRQIIKYLIPQWEAGTTEPGLASFINGTSFFWLFLFVGLAIFAFTLTRNFKGNPKRNFILNLVFAGLVALFSLNAFRETYAAYDTNRHIVSNVMAIVLYVFAFGIGVLIILESTLIYTGKIKKNYYWTMAVIILFAAMCFAFGVKVSYNDYTNPTKPKEIICFLTMIIYTACLLVWRPWISALINVALFLGFYFLIDSAPVANELVKFKDSDLVNYITFLISVTMVTVSIYHQRLSEALKDEELEFLATHDEMTGLLSYSHFVHEVETVVNSSSYQSKTTAVLFFDLVNFKAYNDKKGFVAGNAFLKEVGLMIENAFPGDLLCRQSDDHYVCFTSAPDVEERVNALNAKVQATDKTLRPELKAGAYFINQNQDVRSSTDKARYACYRIIGNPQVHYLLYDRKMHDEFHLMQYIIQNIDNAVENGWIKPFYQPVVWSKNGTLCGVEALARWDDPERGLLPPGQFVPTLENTKLIHKLDAAIIKAVCADIRRCLDHNIPVVPVSINFSRLDFELMDAVTVLEQCVAEYKVPKEYLHVEITESALSDNALKLADSVHKLKELGYALWLDDFGSGYSSLNVLKEFDFDVMKIDLVFLRNFSGNPKARPLIESIIDMATRLGMRTLAEGVETKEQCDFLSEAHCERLQGYLFGKPLPFDELQNKIKSGELKLSKEIF